MLTNARVDEVEAFLDLLADGRWRGNVITLRVKAGLVGGVVNGDQLSLGTRVREGALLHDRLRPVFTFADGLDVAALFGDDIVARFVTAGHPSPDTRVLNNRIAQTHGPRKLIGPRCVMLTRAQTKFAHGFENSGSVGSSAEICGDTFGIGGLYMELAFEDLGVAEISMYRVGAA